MLEKRRRTFSLSSFDQVCAQPRGSDNRQQIDSYRKFLAHAMKALPEKQHDALVLYYLKGMTMEQTAHDLHVSVSTISRRLKSAKSKLRSIAKICLDSGLLH